MKIRIKLMRVDRLGKITASLTGRVSDLKGRCTLDRCFEGLFRESWKLCQLYEDG